MERQSNREGIKGMMNPTRYGIERFAYWLQRLTGLGLLFYLIGHIIETSAIVEGKAAWDKMLELTQTTEGHIILILVIGMSVFHTVNGIRVMLGHYGTALGAVALVAIHILFRMTQDFSASLQYQSVIANYHFLPYALMLEVVLILLSVHGFNGLRVILLELKQGIGYERAVNYGCLGAMTALIVYGSRTILMAGVGMT